MTIGHLPGSQCSAPTKSKQEDRKTSAIRETRRERNPHVSQPPFPFPAPTRYSPPVPPIPAGIDGYSNKRRTNPHGCGPSKCNLLTPWFSSSPLGPSPDMAISAPSSCPSPPSRLLLPPHSCG
ncbi:hypothetical protein B0T18DRAFT_38380 [Schizothecium vesticola]|uniref:Uncharacterized protein n=1 Tax=Schizothecium vesticola TaxID=314040 RepID=A0AA40KD52_9PEZI|nr:hypothetical protein B0T18DRAFT_38380 [Schizothecium vesticola]